MNPIVIIPARMASTRLPGKPLADIAGKPMIARVLERAAQAGCGPVYAAVSEPEVAEAVSAHGGQAVMTDPGLPSGTDRINAALQSLDPDRQFDTVVNVQGDLPTMEPDIITRALSVLEQMPEADIATLVTPCRDEREERDPNVVKAIMSWRSSDMGRALYFTRASAPSGDGPLWHHVGLYVYRRAALETFCQLSPSALETRERLEQLRALEADMIIGAARIDSSPEGVDTPADLMRARKIYEGLSS